MNGNDLIIKEIIAMTKELKASNEKSDVMIGELKAAHGTHDVLIRGLERSQRVILTIIQDQGAQRRRDKRMWIQHNNWLRDHEVRLRTQYRMIRK